MLAGKATIAAVQVLLTEEEAKELSHTLNLYRINASSGREGGGQVITDRIKFCGDLIDQLDKAVSK